MSMLPRVFQCADHRTVDTNRVVRVAAGLADDRIDAPESKPGYFTEPERALPQNIRTGGAEVLIDLHCRYRRDLKRRQQLHNIPHRAAFCVARLDLLQLLLRDAADLQQLLRVILQNVERICAEPLDNASGRAFPDAFEKSRRKIVQKSFRCRRHKLVPVLHMELQAVLAIFPVTLDLQLDGIRLRQSIADSSEPKHPVSERILGTGFFRNRRIIRAHPKNGVFAGFIEVDELIIGCNHSFFHLTQAAGCAAILMLNRLDSDVSTNCS